MNGLSLMRDAHPVLCRWANENDCNCKKCCYSCNV